MMIKFTGYEWKNLLVNIMIVKSDEILNSSLSSGSAKLIIALVALGFLKPVMENQNSRLCRRSLDPSLLEINAGKEAVKEKRSVQAHKLSTSKIN